MPSTLAILGGTQAVTTDPGSIFDWPLIGPEDEEAVLEVLRRGAMSGIDVTQRFESELATWFGRRFALCHNTGTASIHTALFASGVGVGDEVICQSLTLWASVIQVFSLGATVVFSEVDPQTLTLDPADIEHRISDRTKVIVVVHYCGHPADMDPILEIAARHRLKVIEDVSHAQGGLYKGRRLGTLGDIGAMSVMSEKSLACGEGGFLITDDEELYERAVAFGHYERTGQLKHPQLRPFAGMPLGGYKYRMHQLSSALGRVQLRHYQERIETIQKAMNYFWDQLEGVPGLRAHRPSPESGSTMGGWYSPHGLYQAEELGSLSITRFCEAVTAEGVPISPGANPPMHLHPLLNEADVYDHGRPTRIAHSTRDLRQPPGSLPVTESLPLACYSVPWFKRHDAQIIEEHAEAFRKVAQSADALL